MRISTRGRYGLRAMADIAAKARDGAAVVSTRSIAESQSISENYLEQILAQLKERGLLKSVRGAGGGFMLTRGPGEITAGEILRAVEGSLSPAECLDEPGERAKAHSKGCTSCDDCAAKGVLSRVYGSVTEVVDSITILDILDSKSI
ncbi:MAG: Rrf2 family transcriptional regulator [Defluviitaleaceae bacterium]|nr:Rrf2 family transcriptional regulator [Defluviitaleaceae bacterium]MCL2837141.1 Rrf2 family transcriptional regulator [Defluviitaleaceae bacterium]